MNVRTLLAVFASSLVAVSALADEEESETASETAGEEKSAAAADGDAAGKDKKKNGLKATFLTLPFCRDFDGTAEVKTPNGDWQAVEDGRFYPLGSSYRTGPDGSLKIAFGKESFASISADSEFGTRVQPLGDKSRTVVLVRGTLKLELPDNLPENAFFVTAPGFTVSDLAGESKYVYSDLGDGDRATVRCVTGAFTLKGRHFEIPLMRAANEVEIRTSRDLLFTSLSGKSGDYVVKLDQGVRIRDELDDSGQMKRTEEKGVKDWKLSPATKIVIRRAVPSIGERMSVMTMCFDTAGEVKSQCCFCEGRNNVNSGEMAPKDKAAGEELAKRAAEAAQTTETAADATEEKPAEEEEKKEESSEDGEL